MSKFKKGIFMLLLSGSLAFTDDITLERLEELYSRKQISESDYKFLKDELEGKLKEKHLYTLVVNRQVVAYDYPVIYMNGKYYMSSSKLFRAIGFTNYKFENNILEMVLGSDMKKVVIDYTKGTVTENGKQIDTFGPHDVFVQDGYRYAESSKFRAAYLDGLDIDEKRMRISMVTNFNTPIQIANKLERKKADIDSRNTLDSFYYTNSRKFFDFGYMRVQADRTITNQGSGSSQDWSGFLEYQGPFLYGDLTTTYDMKAGELTGANLYYPNLNENHFMQITGTKNSDKQWEKSFLYDRDRGYFEEGKTFIIRENVPIGSRVELIYLGATIAIENEENGLVEFSDSEIRSDREYVLVIHTRDGEIETRTIKTSDYFNQQNRGQFENKIYIRESKGTGKQDYEFGTYYGFTDHLTMGVNYYRTPESVGDSYRYLDRGKIEAVYSNYINQYPYTAIFGSDKIFGPTDYGDRNTFEGLFQIKLPKVKLTYENGFYSEYYNNRKEQSISAQWDPYSFLRITGGYESATSYSGVKKSGTTLFAELTENFGRLLSTVQFEKDIDNQEYYGVNFYYTGYRNYSLRWNNTISERGNDFESSLTLYNRNSDNIFDYQVEVSYNQQDREKYTFRFQLYYDNWFNMNFEGKNRDNYTGRLGIDRIIDLKNPLQPLDSSNRSRVKLFTYIDGNDNNIYDEGEGPIGGVEVTLSDQKVTTDSKGMAYIYGLANDIQYSFEPKVKRPGYDVVDTTFSVKGKGGGDIEAYIPIKPLFTISGEITTDSPDKINILDGLVIRIKDENGETVASTLTDNVGNYDISGLKVGKYFFEAVYFKDANIKSYEVPLEIKYDKKKKNRVIINLEVTESEIKIDEEDGR